MNQEQIEQQIKAVGIDLQNNAKVIAEIMEKQRDPSLKVTMFNYAAGFQINFDGGFFPDGKTCNCKTYSNLKEAISHVLGITHNAFTPNEAEEILSRVVLYNSEPAEINVEN
jgi:hypothetical protein